MSRSAAISARRHQCRRLDAPAAPLSSLCARCDLAVGAERVRTSGGALLAWWAARGAGRG
uniref:Uncharacterized protein n=1 Tax=Arundo donax TaxID=35708 RepID=A0A0A9E5C4_ARUDO